MSLERELKEAFERHASDVAGSPGAAWQAVEETVVRTHRRRAIAITATSLAVVVAAAVAVPAALTSKRSHAPFAGPGPTTTPSAPTSPSPTTPPNVETTPYVSNDRGYVVSVPLRWHTGTFEGHDEFTPPGLPGPEVGGETFFVDISLEFAKIETQVGNDASETTVAGERALVETKTGSEPSKHYAIDWTHFKGCNGPPTCASSYRNGAKTLNVRIYAGSTALWTQYSADGEAMVESILHATSEPLTQHQVLVKFMEYRASNDQRAIGSLSANAKQQYDAHEGGIGLFEWTHDGITERYTRFEIISEDEADANSIEAVVALFTASGETYERLGIGPGESLDGGDIDTVIRFAMATTKP